MGFVSLIDPWLAMANWEVPILLVLLESPSQVHNPNFLQQWEWAPYGEFFWEREDRAPIGQEEVVEVVGSILHGSIYNSEVKKYAHLRKKFEWEWLNLKFLTVWWFSPTLQSSP